MLQLLNSGRMAHRFGEQRWMIATCYAMSKCVVAWALDTYRPRWKTLGRDMERTTLAAPSVGLRWRS
jgi:hypothetical protein